MSTKAEAFASTRERSGPKKKPAPKSTPRAKKAASKERALRETSGRPAGAETAARNVHGKSKSSFSHALEDSGSGRPSRKSTRREANQSKLDGQLERRQLRRTTAPESRARRAAAKDR